MPIPHAEFAHVKLGTRWAAGMLIDGIPSRPFAFMPVGDGEKKQRQAKVIAEALTEYAERHGLAPGWFILECTEC